MECSVRLVTANLANGGAEPRPFAELVAELRADVVAVQEITPEQAGALERVLPHGRLEPARNHLGMGFALRRPAALELLPLPGRPARIARLDGDAWPELAGPLEILNVHVLAPHKWPPWRTLPLRRDQVRELAAYLRAVPGTARALAGDLNATRLWPAYRRIAARFDDAARLAAAATGARPRATWGPGAAAPRLLRIDHVLVEQLRVQRVEVRALPGSDHCAVVADLAPRAARDAGPGAREALQRSSE